jgi:hypothetical protein
MDSQGHAIVLPEQSPSAKIRHGMGEHSFTDESIGH